MDIKSCFLDKVEYLSRGDIFYRPPLMHARKSSMIEKSLYQHLNLCCNLKMPVTDVLDGKETGIFV